MRVLLEKEELLVGKNENTTIAIISAGVLPVPPTKGGAVENLIQTFIEENEITSNFKFHVFTIPNGQENVNSKYVNTKYIEVKNKKSVFTRTKIPFLLSRLNKKYLAYPYLKNILKEIKNKYDYILIENRPEFAIPIIASSPKSKIFIHLHNDYLATKSKENERILQKCSKIIVVSDYIKRNIVSTWGDLAISKCIVLYNGIKDRFHNENAVIKSDKFSVVFHGRVSKDKGTDILVESIALINNPNIELKIIGGSWYDAKIKDDYMNTLKSIINKSDIDVRFTGYIAYENIPRELSTADLIVLPSIWEDPFPLVVLEAMAAGKLIITTNSGGIIEAVGDTAIVIDKNLGRNFLVQSISEKILDVKENPNKYSHLKDMTYDRYKRLFTDKIMYDNFVKILYEEL